MRASVGSETATICEPDNIEDKVGSTARDTISISSNASTVHIVSRDKEANIESQVPVTEKHDTVNSESKDKRGFLSTLRWIILITCVASGPFLYGFDVTVTATLQPQIIEDLGDIEKFSWISVAFSLGSSSTVLLCGKLYAYFNIKWLFIASMVVFETGCAVSGAAPTTDALIAGRALGGVGALGIYLGSMHMVAMVTTIQQRPLYVVFVSVAFMLGTILGPIVGGALGDAVSWRWGLYINICMAALLAPGYLILFPSKSLVSDTMSIKARFQSLDFLGGCLWMGATIITMLAISFGGATFPWNSSQVIGLFSGAAALWILFVTHQLWKLRSSSSSSETTTTNSSQAFPIQFFRSWQMTILFFQTFCGSVQNFLPLFLIPIYFEFTRGSSAISAAYHLLPIVALRGVFVLVNGAGMRKYGHVMPWYLVGSMLCVAGSAPFLVGSPSTATVYGLTVLLGIGSGLYNQASFAVAQARSPPELVSQAITFITAAQLQGFTFPLAISNSIFLNRATSLIGEFLPDVTTSMLEEAITSSGTSRASQTFTGTLNAEDKARVVASLVRALNSTWAMVVAPAVLSVVLSLFMKRDRLFR